MSHPTMDTQLVALVNARINELEGELRTYFEFLYTNQISTKNTVAVKYLNNMNASIQAIKDELKRDLIQYVVSQNTKRIPDWYQPEHYGEEE